MEQKIKHLEMVQSVVSRMANNSFVIKGWCVTLVAALFALGSGSGNTEYVFLAYFPAIMFWILDAYFLWQERLYRKLYEKVRLTDERLIDFSLNTQTVKNNVSSWQKTSFSTTLLIFYGTLIIAILIVILVARV